MNDEKVEFNKEEEAPHILSTPNPVKLEDPIQMKEGGKYFSIRGVPDDVHKMWKIVALYMGITMEELALRAIKRYAEAYIKKQST
jgi:hypothetical protein